MQSCQESSICFQVGLSRSTTGCVAACLFREFQLSASYEGLVETVPGVNLEVLRMDNYQMDKDKDTLFRGEFEVVKELTQALGDEGIASKRECDKVRIQKKITIHHGQRRY